MVNDLLCWMIFSGAVCYARKRWNKMGAIKDITEAGFRTKTWEDIWALQRQLKCPPIGLLRSC